MVVETPKQDVIGPNVPDLQFKDSELAVVERHGEARHVFVETANSGFHMANYYSVPK